MAFCGHCGASNQDGTTFCTTCGAQATPAANSVRSPVAPKGQAPARPSQTTRPPQFGKAGRNLLKVVGYGWALCSIIAGVGGSRSAFAMGVGLLLFMLLVTNAWGLRPRVPIFNSNRRMIRRTGYAGLILLTCVGTASLPQQASGQQVATTPPQQQGQAHATVVHRGAHHALSHQQRAVSTARARRLVSAQRQRIAAQAKAHTVSVEATKTAQGNQQRSDYASVVGQWMGFQDACEKAAQKANTSVLAVTKGDGGGDMVTAYQDAQNAHDACDTASQGIMTLSIPNSLSSLKMDATESPLLYYTDAESHAWGAAQKVINDTQDVADAAEFRKQLDIAQGAFMDSAAHIAAGASQLNMNPSDLKIIPPATGQ